MRGRFITFEGGEGAGKSTHAALLAHRLRTLGIGVVLTREPGGAPGAEVIRQVLLSGAAKPLGAEAEAILFAAARDDHIRNTIGPALASGRWVVCDRFVDSTRVYQGIVGRVDREVIDGLERVAVGPIKPDVTFVLDVPVDEAMARMKKRRGEGEPDRFEGEQADFHERLRKAFRTLALAEPERCVLIDGCRPRSEVAERIWNIVSQRLGPGLEPVSLQHVTS